MPKTLYDEDGNEVQVPAEEEIKALEEKASKIETYESQIREKEEELEKLRSKDMNFSNLRGKTQAEKDELLKDFTEKEKKFLGEIESLSTKVEEYHSATLSSYEDNVLSAMAGEDSDLKTKIKERAKDFVGSPKTREDLFRRYKDAYTLIKGEVPSVNPINQFQPTRSSDIPAEKEDGFTKSEKGKAAYNRWFPDNTYKAKK